MKKYLYIGVVLLTIGIIAFYGLRDKSPGASAAKAATVNPKPRTPKEELQLAESWLVEITKLLNDKHIKKPPSYTIKPSNAWKEVSENASSSKDSQGIDMAKEVGLLRARINDKLVRAMQAEVDALKAGAPDNRCVFHIQAFFGHAKEVDLWKIYESAVPELDAIRCKQASRWIRIYNSSNNRTDYDDLIFSTLAKRIIVPPGYQIAFGPPVGEMERRALFCTVDTDTRPTHNTYSLS
ncbi:MAG: hypothetical protein IPP19_07350 [Verrucomicrobia bacterium]|nr:hypothetical protein [Verrucomicrobiota bacterium]